MNKILQFTAFLALAAPIFGCRNEKPVVQELTPVMEAALNDPSSRYYADFANYPENISQLPIGIFDSDTNEMFVLVRLLNLDEFDNITGEIGSDGIPDLAGEDFIVLASPELKDGNDALTNALQ
ncbi:MAG: hypothetical protein HUJ93_08585, partial [Bacteroidales bacterium]|nr:hypothetical protein [Bacteroidales bacterium]